MAIPTNGHGPAAAGSITRTPSFTPVTPVVKERVADVATRLSEVERIIDDINTQSATNTARSPTMDDLHQEINLLRKDIEETKAAQKKQFDGLRNNVKNDVKEQITRTIRAEIDKKIMDSIQAQVKVVVGEWGESADTKKFIGNLRGMVRENNALSQDAKIKLDNSNSRHENSILDEHADFETRLSKIKLPDGNVSNAFPNTLKELFLYDEKKLLRVLDDYDFLDEPPAYPSPNVLEPSKEKPAEAPPAPPPTQVAPTKIEKKIEKTEVTPEVRSEPERKPPQEPAAESNTPVQAQLRGRELDGRRTEEKRDVHQDRVGHNPAGTEPPTPSRQPSTVSTNQRPQQTVPIPPAKVTNRIHPPASPQQPPNAQGGINVGGWFKSIADNF